MRSFIGEDGLKELLRLMRKYTLSILPGNILPKSNGTANAGTSTNFSREDHVHPLQTNVSGNAGTSDKLKTARKLTIGSTAKDFDGSKDVSWTLSDIGAASSSHGTHVTYSTTTPKANGTASVGTENTVSRGDHVHPLQTTISGNAGTATKLATGRTLTIGSTGKAFNGSADVTWSRNDIQSAYGWESQVTESTAGWYRVAESLNGIQNNMGLFVIDSYVSGTHSSVMFVAGTNYGNANGTIITQIAGSNFGAFNVTQARIVYHTSYSGNYAYIEVYASKTNTRITTRFFGFGWKMITPIAGSIPSGYSNKAITFFIGGPQATKSDTATKLQTARNINGTTFDGTSDINIARSYTFALGRRGVTTACWQDFCTVATTTAGSGAQDEQFGSCIISGTGIHSAAKGTIVVDFGVNGSNKTANVYVTRISGNIVQSQLEVGYYFVDTVFHIGIKATGYYRGQCAITVLSTNTNAYGPRFAAGSSLTAAPSGWTPVTMRILEPATATPVVAGTGAVGTSLNYARQDHVHPAQTSVSGNAGTATKLATARTITIGSKGNTFDGSANIAYSLADIGASDRNLLKNNYVSITVAGEATKYYPVLITNGHTKFGWSHLFISRAYNETAPDTWNNSTHKGGLTLGLRWTGDSSWGGNDHRIVVEEFHETYCKMLGGLKICTNGLVVWLRGGTATYHIETEYGKAAAATVYLTTYTDSGKTEYPVRDYNAATVSSEVNGLWYDQHGTYNGIASGSRMYTATFKTASWTLSGTTYTQTVTCTGVTASDDLEAPQVAMTTVKATNESLVEGLGVLCTPGNFGETLAGQIKWTCYGSKPAVDLVLYFRKRKV